MSAMDRSPDEQFIAIIAKSLAHSADRPGHLADVAQKIIELLAEESPKSSAELAIGLAQAHHLGMCDHQITAVCRFAFTPRSD